MMGWGMVGNGLCKARRGVLQEELMESTGGPWLA